MDYLTITWGIEKGLDLGFFTLRWYSLLFALGFILGYRLMSSIFAKEGIPKQKLDVLLNYTVIATIVGARLGHVFFYQWDYYKMHPDEIIKIWEGGLASHGAAIALILAMYLYGKRVVKKGMFWSLDRLVITVALAASLIRLGNWMNSEIYGKIDNSFIETVFTKPTTDFLTGQSAYGPYYVSAEMTPTGEKVETDSVVYPVYTLSLGMREGLTENQAHDAFFQGAAPSLNNRVLDERHLIIEDNAPYQFDGRTMEVRVLGVPRLPTQLFESFGYLLVFVVLFKLYNTGNYKDRRGYLFGAFLVMVFGFRFVIEFWKANQSAFESELLFNMGQWLSIPLVIIGAAMMIRAKESKEESADASNA